MNKQIKNIIEKILGIKKLETNEEQMDKATMSFYISIKSSIKEIAFMLVGIFSAAFGLKGFLLPNDFLDGGATGISLLISELTDIPIYILIIVVNIPFIILGIKAVNKTFAVKTAISILGLSLVLATVSFPEITNDKLLISIFGGFFLGAGIGMAIRGGAVIDGTEVLAVYLGRRSATSIGDIIMVFNVIIFAFAAYLISIETALYAMLTYLAASKTVDFIVEGIEEYVGLTIISDHTLEIQEMLKDKLNRGYTIYKRKRGSGKRGEKIEESEVIYTVITRLELGKLYTEIEKIDNDAFIVSSLVKDIRGGMVKK
ncbi:MAG TPA: YitT family protein, partial [Chitinophagales bacterium]|nr:YitT family protein [Chitinophagales bacterium]HMZ34630.1 YitT family protein [Chitinophagales bacterium]HNC72623.1 YitT family protein [Chitinophagales bacterium]HNF52107.1 YitT family protein [Chitinophagales bacterium]HNJ02353.1 YitT family protein [Chitinophagales bacterium]